MPRRPREQPRIFLLSPANCGGPRARLMTSPNAAFELARQLQSRQGAALGDVFSFVSGLYFRGKLAYARRFARPPDPADAVVAAACCDYAECGPPRGRYTVTVRSFQGFASTDISLANAAYCKPLEQAARQSCRPSS